MPLSARMRPSRTTAAASATGIESRGPHRGQAFGCAWKRRSAGVVYSRRQSAHISNARMVVHGRSYGISRTME